MESYTGGCACGAIRYEVAAIFDAGWCHCRICTRSHGCALPWFCFRPDDFAMVAGQPRSWRVSSRGVASFCGVCGTPMGWTPDDMDTGHISMPIGTLDHPEMVSPRIHQWWSLHLPWFPAGDDLPRVEDGRLPHPDRRAP